VRGRGVRVVQDVRLPVVEEELGGVADLGDGALCVLDIRQADPNRVRSRMISIDRSMSSLSTSGF
jgi:hypothetical protein